MALEHDDRRRWFEQIDRLNRQRNEEDEARIASLTASASGFGG